MAKLILTHEVTGLGAAGDVIEVKDGYARNFLLPRGFALTWTKGGEKQVESIKAARVAREHASLGDAQKQAAALSATPVKLVVKAAACSARSSRPTLLTLLRPLASAASTSARLNCRRTSSRLVPTRPTSVCTTTLPL